MLRPGNYEITKAATEAAGLKKGERILDVGCGMGDSARFLTDSYGLSCTGIDMNLRFIQEAKENNPDLDIRFGDGEFLDDFTSSSFDAVYMECVLSVMNTPDEALHEAWCVLKKGGKLILTDLFHINPSRKYVEEVKKLAIEQAKHTEHEEGDCEDRPPRQTDFLHGGKFLMGPLADQIERLGFQITWFEDRTDDLVQYMADVILDGEEDSIICKVEDRKNTGYFAMVAEKL